MKRRTTLVNKVDDIVCSLQKYKVNNRKIYEDETGRPIISGDGIVAQIERFANKFVFSKLNVKYFRKALNAMITKSEKPKLVG